MTTFQVSIEISNRHVHLTQEHVESLFGSEHSLTPAKALSQPGQFACEETVTLVGPKGNLVGVRVLGPMREQSQVELAATDTFKLGVHPPVRDSGDLAGTPGLELVGPAGSVILDSGVIVAARHIHMTPGDAVQYGVLDGTHVRVEIPGLRGGIFNNVLVRVGRDSHLNMHIDTDEGNGFAVRNGDPVQVTADSISLAAR